MSEKGILILSAVVGIAAGGLIIHNQLKSPRQTSRDFKLTPGRTYEFVGYIDPAIPAPEIPRFARALELGGATNFEIVASPEQGVDGFRYLMPAVSLTTVTLGEPLFTFGPHKLILVSVAEIGPSLPVL